MAGGLRAGAFRILAALCALAASVLGVSIAGMGSAAASKPSGGSGPAPWGAVPTGKAGGSHVHLPHWIVDPHGHKLSQEILATSNWAGLVNQGAQFTGVGGEWHVPSVPPTLDTEVSGTWIGLDGVTNETLIQTGTTEASTSAGNVYYAWYELYPAPPVTLGLVEPGDLMDASIFKDSTGVWTISISDLTSSNGSSGEVSYSGPGTSAEWIDEAPSTSSGTQETLADFGSVQFTNLGISGSGLGSAYGVPVYMLNALDQVIAYPILDSSTDSMVIDYGSPPPPTVTSVAPTQGSTLGGTSVTIDGTNLDSAYEVDFGGVPAPFGVDSSGEITATAPPGVGTVDVTVLTLAGLSPVSSADQFTYVAPVPSAYTPVNPYRICDTRAANGLSGTDAQCAGHTVAAGGTLTIQVTGTNPSGTSSGGVPASGVTAVVLNITAVGERGQGYVTVWPVGDGRPTASSLNYRADKTVPNLVTVGVLASGRVSLFASAGTDLVVDVEGYYASPSGTAGLFNSVSPYRICDTRGAEGLTGTNAQCAGHTLSAGGTLSIQVTGTNPSGTSSGGLPSSGVAAVVLNVTVVGHATGYLTAFPTGAGAPNASNLNFSSGQVVANRVIVPVGAGGEVTLTTNSSTDVIVDVNGWFTDGTSLEQTGALFVAAPPSRICDTRNNGNGTQCQGATVHAGTPLRVEVAGVSPVPSLGVVAATMNLTVADASTQSYLTAWPTGDTRPTASDVNWPAGVTTPNMAVVGLGTDGEISLYVNNGTADVIVDITGWYVNST